MSATVENVEYKDTTIPVVYEHSSYIPIVSMQLVFTDSGHLANTKDGLATLSAKLLGEGTSKDGATKFAKKLDNNAIELNAHTGRETFVIEVSALKEKFDTAMDLLQELLKDPNYTQDALEQIKRQQLGYLAQKQSDYDYITSLNLREILFDNSALARPYDGTPQSIESIKLDDIKKFISKHLGYDNLIVVAGGDISDKELQDYTKKIASLLPKVEVKKLAPIKVSDKKVTRYITKDTQQAYIYFGAPFDYSYEAKDQYKAKIAEFVLGGSGFGSRLMEEIRVKRGLSYGAYCMLRETKEASYLSGYLQTKIATQEEAKAIVQKVVDDFIAKGITAKELQSAKDFLVGSEPLRVESLAQRLHRAFNEFYYNRGLGYSKKQLQDIENATLDEVNEFIKSHKELRDISFAIVTSENKKVEGRE